METLKFENLPSAISLLIREVNSIKHILEDRPLESVNELMTVEQTSTFLTLAKPTVYAMISRGELPNFKRGKRVYFHKTDLINYLEAGRRRSNSELKKKASE